MATAPELNNLLAPAWSPSSSRRRQVMRQHCMDAALPAPEITGTAGAKSRK
jgi:hypothetical protein